MVMAAIRDLKTGRILHSERHPKSHHAQNHPRTTKTTISLWARRERRETMVRQRVAINTEPAGPSELLFFVVLRVHIDIARPMWNTGANRACNAWALSRISLPLTTPSPVRGTRP